MLGRGKKAKAARLFQEGAQGVGTVQHVQDTGMTINDNPRVKMVFRVEPIDGSAAFDAQKTKTVSRVEIPRAGDRYPVWYDREDPAKTWAYATASDEQGRQQLRQIFGAAADGFVGMGGAPPAAAAPAPAPQEAEDPLDRLKKLDELHKAGVLSDSEFEEQKAKLLAAM
jgi:Short C-terminal domain